MEGVRKVTLVETKWKKCLSLRSGHKASPCTGDESFWAGCENFHEFSCTTFRSTI